MSFHWSQYLTVAQELASTSATSRVKEGNLRSAISRAYYGAFCQARNHLLEKDREPIPYGVNVHMHVVHTFESSSDTTRQKVGQLLHHLRSTRNKADYENIFYGNLPARTRAALAEAERIIHLLETL